MEVDTYAIFTDLVKAYDGARYHIITLVLNKIDAL